jgi:hypothetical protein
MNWLEERKALEASLKEVTLVFTAKMTPVQEEILNTHVHALKLAGFRIESHRIAPAFPA